MFQIRKGPGPLGVPVCSVCTCFSAVRLGTELIFPAKELIQISLKAIWARLLPNANVMFANCFSLVLNGTKDIG